MLLLTVLEGARDARCLELVAARLRDEELSLERLDVAKMVVDGFVALLEKILLFDLSCLEGVRHLLQARCVERVHLLRGGVGGERGRDRRSSAVVGGHVDVGSGSGH